MKKRIHVILPDWQHKCAKDVASELNISTSEVMRLAFDFLELARCKHKTIKYSDIMKGEVKHTIDEIHHKARVACSKE
jgi:hypothetical protein